MAIPNPCSIMFWSKFGSSGFIGEVSAMGARIIAGKPPPNMPARQPAKAARIVGRGGAG